MQKIKYTSDGRKVVVLGQLNAQETIVQEVFIIDGNEIPSGANFVVKSLHDAPAVSWKEKRVAEIEQSYKLADAAYRKHEAALRDARLKVKEKLEYTGKALKNISPESFDAILMFLTGEVKYYVIADYTPKIIKAEDLSEMYDRHLRLLSIFGEDDGTLTYGLGAYHDYSGSHKTIYPFRTHEEAVAKLTEVVKDAKYISRELYAMAEQYGITLDAEKVELFKASLLKNAESEVDTKKAALEQAESKLETAREIVGGLPATAG
jgi:hypothetical protein